MRRSGLVLLGEDLGHGRVHEGRLTEDGGGGDEGVGGQDGARVPLRAPVPPEGAQAGRRRCRRLLPLAADAVDDEAVTND